MMNKNSEKSNRYNKKNTIQYIVRLNKNTDTGLIEHMEHQENKQGFLKGLIKEDMMKKAWSKFNEKNA